VCRRRRIVKRIDATELLWKASRQFALSVIHLWDAPAIVREFLETGDETKRVAAWDAARAAAWDAAWATAEAAAWAAARVAARAAAWDAAWVAAWNTAWNAARAAAWNAARAAALDAQKEIFATLVNEAFEQ
jgi:hypothetical protein